MRYYIMNRGDDMTDFYSFDICKEIREDLYTQLKVVREKLNREFPEWWNPHDYASGYYDGRKDSLIFEEKFLADMLDKLERS